MQNDAACGCRLHVSGLSLHSLARRSRCCVVSCWAAAPAHWDHCVSNSSPAEVRNKLSHYLPTGRETRWIVQSWTSKVYFRLFRSLACGCRFGSGPGCFWVGVCRPRFCPWFRSVSVESNSERKKGTDPKSGSHFLIGIPYTRCSWTLVPCIRSHESAGHVVVFVVTGQMVGDRRSPGRQYWGRDHQPLPPTNVSFPPTGREHSDASWCGQCTRWQVVYIQTGSFSRVFSGTSVHSARGVAASFLSRCCGSRIFVHVAAATSASCRGTSKQSITLQMFLQLQTLRRMYHVLSRQACLFL